MSRCPYSRTVPMASWSPVAGTSRITCGVMSGSRKTSPLNPFDFANMSRCVAAWCRDPGLAESQSASKLGLKASRRMKSSRLFCACSFQKELMNFSQAAVSNAGAGFAAVSVGTGAGAAGVPSSATPSLACCSSV